MVSGILREELGKKVTTKVIMIVRLRACILARRKKSE